MDCSRYVLQDLEEKLREYASIGDERSICQLLDQGVAINSQNSTNGWSALHWAARRGFPTTTSLLLSSGAEKHLKTLRGETAIQLTSDEGVRKLLYDDADDDTKNGAEDAYKPTRTELPIQPHYLQQPQFPYANSRDMSAVPGASETVQTSGASYRTSHVSNPDELVLKSRVDGAAETDFIEVELSGGERTFDGLVRTLCTEHKVSPSRVRKVRKLPNTIVRKDRDVQRLHDFQELELCLYEQTLT